MSSPAGLVRPFTGRVAGGKGWKMRGRALVFASLTTLAPAASADLQWIVPEDGGTPRDPGRIEQLAPETFRIRASFEDGGQSILRHAVSRVDLWCRNTGELPVTLTVQLDLSGDGQRTDYDSKPEAGMKLRDFVFIQPPGSDWQQVNGSTVGWVATVKFTVPPGDTKLGLSPWYGYGDCVQFVNGLPAHPHLEKKLSGKTEDGREHWELTITDPAVRDEEKRTIFWQAREHAYETYSSYAMEGLVPYLLSEEAAGFRQRYRIVLHPMTNVDGVARGFEYRAGYDLPGLRLTAAGRFTLEAVDRLKPYAAVAWHNWIAPRDRNVVFYTHGKDGRSSAGAWWRFTQLFPSLRGYDHRWKDETTPLRYNWLGRHPLSEGNIHQYAMLKYGTAVWGWEMPWWNHTVKDARDSGAAFARAFLTTMDEIRENTIPDVKEMGEVAVPRWAMHEFRATGRAHADNRFRDTALTGEFTSPAGKTRVVDGFYDGDDTWKLRFAPDEEGEWRYLLRGEGVEILQRGAIRCTAAQTAGTIRIHPENPYAFARADGTAFFPMGDTCYGLFDDSPITPALRAEYLKTRRAQQFNFVRLTVGHSEFRAADDPAWWAWGGTAQQPDFDRFNPVFFRAFDALMEQLRAAGMNTELILLNFYRRPFTDTAQWTPARERLWLRYLLARYAAFDNVFLWTVANEYETHPDGKYRLDFPDDVEWAKATARFIQENDSQRHPVTVHPVVSASRRGGSPRDIFDPPWRIGEFFGGNDAVSVLSQQTGQSGEGTAWDEARGCWTGDSATLTASIRADRRFGKPVLNTESGYEHLRGQPDSRKQVHDTDKVRRSAWRIVCAGGCFAAGFNGTLGHSDVWNRIDAPNKYTFLVKDEGAAGQLKILYEFFTALPFWRLEPFDGVSGGDGPVALAEPGKLCVVYLPHGGRVTADLTAMPESLTGNWFAPRTGMHGSGFPVRGGGRRTFEAPEGSGDHVLVIKAGR